MPETMKSIIEKKITEVFSPESLEVINESHLHEGHAGDDGSGESHFKLKIVSQKFAGCGRVDRYRMVHSVLADELKARIHALSIQAKAPEEL